MAAWWGMINNQPCSTVLSLSSVCCEAVILVPSPNNVAEDHQTKNALALVNKTQRSYQDAAAKALRWTKQLKQ